MQRIKLKHRCSDDTARMIACTSWGAYQMMGENIYAPTMVTYAVDPPDLFVFLDDLGMQDRAFGVFLKLRAIDFTLEELLMDPAKMTLFCRTYNGPDNADAYAARIKAYAI